MTYIHQLINKLDSHNKERKDFHDLEQQLLSIKCRHKNVENKWVSDEVNGIEYYGHCNDCGEDLVWKELYELERTIW